MASSEEEDKHDGMVAGGRENSWLLFSFTSVRSVSQIQNERDRDEFPYYTYFH